MIQTIQGKTYAVICANDCTITTAEGQIILEVTANQQGYFVAPSVQVNCSDDSATITMSFDGAPSGTSSDGGIELTQSHTGIVYSADEDAAPNSNFTAAIIDKSRIPKGVYTAIELPQRIGYSAYPDTIPLYLVIQESSPDDDETFTTIAISDNANIPATSGAARWEFSSGFSLTGGNIKIIPSDIQGVPDSTHCFGGRCVSTGITGDSVVEFGERRNRWRLCARFEGTYDIELFTPIDHSIDALIHLSDNERSLLASGGNVINHELVPVETNQLAIELTPTIVPEYTLGDLTELTVTGISIEGASSSTIATAEFWLTTGTQIPTVTWPIGAIWLNGTSVGSAPSLQAGTAYRIAVSQEPSGLVILNLMYNYGTANENE